MNQGKGGKQWKEAPDILLWIPHVCTLVYMITHAYKTHTHTHQIK